MSLDHFSAREKGIPVAQGPAIAADFPMLADPTLDLYPRDLSKVIRTVGEGEFKLDNRFMPGISEAALRAELVEIPDHGKTREESGHQVFFGQLLLNGEDEGEHSLHVAVKPFPDDAGAVREYGVESYFAAGKVPQCETYVPLGITRLSDGQVGIISHYRHSVRTMDGIFWNPNLIEDPAITAKALGRAGISMSLLHLGGWVHGDAQVKNVAWDVLRPSDHTVIPDLEEAQPIERMSKADTDDLRELDLNVFIGSLFQLQEADVELPEDYPQQIKKHFGMAYVGNRIRDRLPTSIDITTIGSIIDANTNR